MTLGPNPYPPPRRRQPQNPLSGMVAGIGNPVANGTPTTPQGAPVGAADYFSSVLRSPLASPSMRSWAASKGGVAAPAMMGVPSPVSAAPSPVAEMPKAPAFGAPAQDGTPGAKAGTGLLGALDEGRQDQHRLRLAGALMGETPGASITPQARALADALANYREADAPGLLRAPLGLPTPSIEEQAATVRTAMTAPNLFGFQDPASALFAKPGPSAEPVAVPAATRDPDWVEGLFSGW